MMVSRPKNRSRRVYRSDVGSYWISFSDMLSSLLLVFVLALVFSIYQYYTQLDIKTKELDQQKKELDRTQIVLAAQEKELEESRVVLMGKEEELASIQIQLDQQKDDLNAAQVALKAKEEEQAALQLQLVSQQRQIDDLLGLRTEIIKELSLSMSQAALGVKVDPSTGDIILDSQLMFESGRDLISASGQEQLAKLIPVYVSVLTRPEYVDFVAEIIIEGHTDSKGSYLFNLELSQNRALSVAKFCLELGSLSAEQRALLTQILTAKGRSFSNLIRNPDGTENMDASRRVEIKFRLKDTEMIQKMNEILTAQPAT